MKDFIEAVKQETGDHARAAYNLLSQNYDMTKTDYRRIALECIYEFTQSEPNFDNVINELEDFTL